MSREEEQVVVFPCGSLQIEIVQQVDGGQRKPRHTEYCHHGYQHSAKKSKKSIKTNGDFNGIDEDICLLGYSQNIWFSREVNHSV